MQRRDFVIATGSLLATAGTGATAAASTTTALPRQPLILVPPGLRVLNGATFEGVLHQTFNVYASQRGVSMQLVEVRQEKSSAGTEQFTLVFSAPGVTLPSGTYEVEQSAIGKTDIFLQQGEAGKDVYLAHFNLKL